MNLPDGLTTTDLLAELDRELEVRARVYPQWVAARKLLDSTAKHRIACLVALRELVARLPGAAPAQPSLFGGAKP